MFGESGHRIDVTPTGGGCRTNPDSRRSVVRWDQSLDPAPGQISRVRSCEAAREPHRESVLNAVVRCPHGHFFVRQPRRKPTAPPRTALRSPRVCPRVGDPPSFARMARAVPPRLGSRAPSAAESLANSGARGRLGVGPCFRVGAALWRRCYAALAALELTALLGCRVCRRALSGRTDRAGTWIASSGGCGSWRQ